MAKQRKNSQLRGVLLDTNLLIYLADEQSHFHERAVEFFDLCEEEGVPLFISTICIAEYLVKGQLSDLPLDFAEVIPFNMEHAEKAGTFARVLFDKSSVSTGKKQLIWNDLLILAQAAWEKAISHFVTSDKRCIKNYEQLKNAGLLDFMLIDFTKVNPPQIVGRLL